MKCIYFFFYYPPFLLTSSKVQVSELMLSDHKLLTTMLFCLNTEIKHSTIGQMQPFQSHRQALIAANVLLLWMWVHTECRKKAWVRDFFKPLHMNQKHYRIFQKIQEGKRGGFLSFLYFSYFNVIFQSYLQQDNNITEYICTLLTTKVHKNHYL